MAWGNVVEFRLLGPVELLRAGARVNLGAAKQRNVLTVLLWNAGQPVPVSSLIDHVWGVDAPDRARQSLYSYLTRLRSTLAGCGATIARTQGGGYLLDVDPETVDVHRFRRLVGEARTAPTVVRQRLLRDALDLWRDVPLAGMEGCWAERVRAGLEDLRVESCIAWGEAALAGNSTAVVSTAGEMLQLHPLNEQLATLLMRALEAEGRRAEALACYAAMRGRLLDELGSEPGPALQGLHLKLLQDNRWYGPRPLVDQLFGRSADQTELLGLTAHHRLVTVTGLGGSGKSALALHTARRFPDDVVVLDVAALTGMRHAVGTLARLLDVPARPNPLSAVEQALDGRRPLLVVDNCERHPARVAALVGRLLARCRKLTVLATSRQPLGLADEVVWRLPPLDRSAAVALFAQRALQAGCPTRDRALISSICARLDDSPLALELAAARLPTFPLRELAARLGHDLDLLFRTGCGAHRHRSLAAAIGLDQLPGDERHLLARLAAFPAGADLATVEAVAGTLVPLAALVDRCLVRSVETDGRMWFRLPATVRALAAQPESAPLTG